MDKRAINTERQRSRYYKASRSIVRKALKSYEKQFIEDIKKCSSVAQMKQAAEKQIRSTEIEKALKQVYYPVGKHFGEQTFKALMPWKKAIDFGRSNPITEDYWFAWVEKMLKGSLGQRIKWITETTRDVFISVVDRIAYEGFEAGKSVQDIAKEIMQDLNITQQFRAERIARTEVISASNMSSQAGAQATGLELDKEWISYIDDRTRDSHMNQSEGGVGGEKVDINETFSNGLEVPGDPSGEAEEVINCRCTIGYSAKEGGEYSWGREI